MRMAMGATGEMIVPAGRRAAPRGAVEPVEGRGIDSRPDRCHWPKTIKT